MIMNWFALRNELAASAYLLETDRLTSERDLVATALAIVERMSVETREVSWRPMRLLTGAANSATEGGGNATGANAVPPSASGNAPVRLVTTPRKPAPGGIALQPIDAFAIGG